MDDNEILALYFARDEQAIVATQLKYGTYCMSIAQRILNQQQDSEECVSDTWLRTWNAIPPAAPEHLRPFVGKITRNLALNRLRTESAQRRGGGNVMLALDELRDCLSDQPTPEDALEEKLISDAVNRFLTELPPEKRVAFVLRYWYFYSIPEISEKMNLRESKLKSMLFRLRKELKAHLEQEGIAL